MIKRISAIAPNQNEEAKDYFYPDELEIDAAGKENNGSIVLSFPRQRFASFPTSSLSPFIHLVAHAVSQYLRWGWFCLAWSTDFIESTKDDLRILHIKRALSQAPLSLTHYYPPSLPSSANTVTYILHKELQQWNSCKETRTWQLSVYAMICNTSRDIIQSHQRRPFDRCAATSRTRMRNHCSLMP
jgi:hypothetical protein